jgi:hypothetical protein
VARRAARVKNVMLPLAVYGRVDNAKGCFCRCDNSKKAQENTTTGMLLLLLWSKLQVQK